MAAELIILPVVRIKRTPDGVTETARERRRRERRESNDELMRADLNLGCFVRSAVGANVSLARVELWFRTEAEAQKFFKLIKQSNGK